MEISKIPKVPKLTKNSKVLLKNYPMKKIHVSNTLLKFSWFLKFCQFLRFQMTIWINRHKYCQFFVIIVEKGVLYVMIEWSDNISRKCQKWTNLRSRLKLHNFGQFWALLRNLRWKLPNKKKNFMSHRQFWNFRNFW